MKGRNLRNILVEKFNTHSSGKVCKANNKKIKNFINSILLLRHSMPILILFGLFFFIVPRRSAELQNGHLHHAFLINFLVSFIEINETAIIRNSPALVFSVHSCNTEIKSW